MYINIYIYIYICIHILYIYINCIYISYPWGNDKYIPSIVYISSLSQRLNLQTMLTLQKALHASNSDMTSSLICISSFNQRLILQPKDLPEEVAGIEFGHDLILQIYPILYIYPFLQPMTFQRALQASNSDMIFVSISNSCHTYESRHTHTHTSVRYATRTSDVIYISLKLPPFDQTECRALIRDSFVNTQSSIHLIRAVVVAHSDLHTHTLIRGSFVTHSWLIRDLFDKMESLALNRVTAS